LLPMVNTSPFSSHKHSQTLVAFGVLPRNGQLCQRKHSQSAANNQGKVPSVLEFAETQQQTRMLARTIPFTQIHRQCLRSLYMHTHNTPFYLSTETWKSLTYKTVMIPLASTWTSLINTHK
jgi:hypothetical protein